MRVRVLMALGAVLATMVLAAPAQAIKGGVPDAGAHPYVG
jgi:Trypsin